jgi:RNA polymerase sigma-70 factor (ECF subfamily)
MVCDTLRSVERPDNVDAAVLRARTRWPAIALDAEAFTAALRARGIDPAEAGLALEELVLAHACGRGDAAAIAAFDREYIAKIPQFLARVEPRSEIVDEVRQRVRARVLVAEGHAAPRIAEFGGRGPLGAWLRVVTRSVHSNLARERPVGDTTVPEHAVPPAGLSPELEALRERYLPLLNTAVHGAITALSPRDRTLFKLHYLDGLALDRIGVMYGVHKATVSRWLAAARQSVLERATAAVVEALGTRHADARSLLDVLRSQLDVSVATLLA